MRFLLIVSLAIALALEAQGQQYTYNGKVKVVLISGDTVEGTVVSSDTGNISLQTIFGPITFELSNCQQIIKKNAADSCEFSLQNTARSAFPEISSSPAPPRTTPEGEKKIIKLLNGDRVEGVIVSMVMDSMTIYTLHGYITFSKAFVTAVEDPPSQGIIIPEMESTPIQNQSVEEHLTSNTSVQAKNLEDFLNRPRQKATADAVGIITKEGELSGKYGWLYGIKNTTGNMFYLNGHYRFNEKFGIRGDYLTFILKLKQEVTEYKYTSMFGISVPTDSQRVTKEFKTVMNYTFAGPVFYLINGIEKDISGEIANRSLQCTFKPGLSIVSFDMPGFSSDVIMGFNLDLEIDLPFGDMAAVPILISYSGLVISEEFTGAWNFNFDLVWRPFRAFQNFQIKLGTLINALKGQDKVKMFNIGLSYGFGPLYKSFNVTGGNR